MVKIKNWPPMEKYDGNDWSIFKTRSKSDPGNYHITAVRYIPDPAHPKSPVLIDFVCSCEGFKYNNSCWHIKEITP